jgi:predicted CoA-binding protein
MGYRSDVETPLRESKTIAVVGMSPRPNRPSHYVAKYLMEQGYKVIPVNPAVEEVLGMKSYPDIVSIPERVDMVDIFRRSSQVPPVVEDAIEAGARFIWMQDGVVNEDAATRARAAGMSVVMDNCTLREHSRLYGASGAD